MAQDLRLRNFAGDHFGISIPDGWIEMPADELRTLSVRLQAASPKFANQSVHYGYKLSATAPYPQILIQIQKSGRLSENTLARLSSIKAVNHQLSAALKSLKRQVNADSLKVENLRWDSATEILWQQTRVVDPNGNPVTIQAGMLPTGFGSISVNCYSTQSEFESLAPVFTEVIRSVAIDPQFRYNHRRMSARVADSMLLPSLIGCVCTLFIVWLVRRWHKIRLARTPPGKVRSGAAWKVPLGLILLLGHISSLTQALDGDGWLQSSDEAQGYWFEWGAMVTLALFLLCSAAFGWRAQKSQVAADEPAV